ncbi:MAG: methyltransferase domain-containing protein [Pseudomonadota bacterium]
MLTDDQRARTLHRYQQHRAAWETNEALRALYGEWYGRVAAMLPDPALGPAIEIGSGPGFARAFIPRLELTDIVRAPWHDREISADKLPFASASVGALVLFDVLHHLADAGSFFEQATRALAPGGRIVLCEPYLSPASFPVYRWLHEEPVVLGVDPLAVQTADKDPFDSNQAIPTLLFDRGRGRAAFTRRFPELALKHLERLAGLAYPASGGFGGSPVLPIRLWRALHAAERRLPGWAYRLIGFRMLVVLQRL